MGLTLRDHVTVRAVSDPLLEPMDVVAGRDLSLMLHEWLTASDRFTDICWRTGGQWKSGEAGAGAPM
jgi:hypothetical protein